MELYCEVRDFEQKQNKFLNVLNVNIYQKSGFLFVFRNFKIDFLMYMIEIVIWVYV